MKIKCGIVEKGEKLSVYTCFSDAAADLGVSSVWLWKRRKAKNGDFGDKKVYFDVEVVKSRKIKGGNLGR